MFTKTLRNGGVHSQVTHHAKQAPNSGIINKSNDKTPSITIDLIKKVMLANEMNRRVQITRQIKTRNSEESNTKDLPSKAKGRIRPTLQLATGEKKRIDVSSGSDKKKQDLTAGRHPLSKRAPLNVKSSLDKKLESALQQAVSKRTSPSKWSEKKEISDNGHIEVLEALRQGNATKYDSHNTPWQLRNLKREDRSLLMNFSNAASRDLIERLALAHNRHQVKIGEKVLNEPTQQSIFQRQSRAILQPTQPQPTYFYAIDKALLESNSSDSYRSLKVSDVSKAGSSYGDGNLIDKLEVKFSDIQCNSVMEQDFIFASDSE
jgi:hypothetical protein